MVRADQMVKSSRWFGLSRKVVPLLSRIPIERIRVERGRHVNNDGRIGVDGLLF